MNDGREDIRGAIEGADPVDIASARNARSRRDSPQDGGHNGNGGPRQEDADLEKDGPIIPIGVYGTTNIFLDAKRQLIQARPNEMGNTWLRQYFAGDIMYLAERWPRYDREGNPTGGYAPDGCCSAIQRGCSDAGLWNDGGKIRGRGAWRGEDGGLVYHCGDRIYLGAKIKEPGVHDGMIYPAGARLLEPYSPIEQLPRMDDGDHAAAWILYDMFKTWAWRRGALDARLMFGSMIAGFLGGALEWRPHSWITGEKGSGKTTLQDIRRDVMQGWSLNSSNATAAGVHSHVGFDAIAVSLDEQENTADNRALDAMVKLARDASSGDLILRGSANHKGVAFQARNCFCFSSINVAALQSQDVSRTVQLVLETLPKDSVEPDWTRRQAANWGREILRNLMDQWPRWDDTLAAYRADLKKLGHDARGQDTFGTLLAAADLALSETGFLAGVEDPDADEIWSQLNPTSMPEYQETEPEWRKALNHLFASKPADWKPGTGAATIGGVITRFMYEEQDEDARFTLPYVNELLAFAGVRVVNERFGDQTQFGLFIPSKHRALIDIFNNTQWKGSVGADGPWCKAIARGPTGTVLSGAKVRKRVEGVLYRGVVVALNQVLSEE